MRARRRSWFDEVVDDVDIDRTQIFMPVIMSAGLLISLLTLLRDAVHRRRWRSHDRAAWVTTTLLSDHVRTGRPMRDAAPTVMRPRASYFAITVLGAVLALVASVAGAAAYIDDDSPFRHGGAVLAGALLVALAAGTTAVIAAALWARNVQPPRWAVHALASTPLGARTAGPPDRRTAVAAVTASVAALTAVVLALTLTVAPRFDRSVARALVDLPMPGFVDRLHALGNTQVVLVLAALIGIATLRCAPFAIAYVGAVLAGFASSQAGRMIFDRARPRGGLGGLTDSFPSGHAVQVTIIAGLLPFAVALVTRRNWAGVATAIVFGVALALDAVMRVQDREHWPADVVAGIAIGVAIVGAALAFLGDRRLHVRCDRCLWSGPTPVEQLRGVVPIGELTERRVRIAATVWTFGIVAFLALAAARVGLPANPEGDSLGSRVEAPAQLGLLIVVGLGAGLGARFPSVGAVLVALGGAGLGVLAAVQYELWVSMVLTAAFLLGAVGFWLSWQRHRGRRAVAALATITAVILVVAAVAAARVYDRYWGPSHPSSPLVALPVDRVDWAWSGGLTADEAMVVARLSDRDGDRARLRVRAGDGPPMRTDWERPDDGEVVRLRATGLEPATRYTWRVDVDGHGDRTRGRGTFRTPAIGATSLRVAVGSCARSGSNGKVFDRIRALDPDLYVVSGDLNYQNIGVDDIELYRSAYRMALTAPAQAALYRAVPVAYVWDDHDYGANDADASSPSRPAARAAYRENAPFTELPVDGPIAQAFTMGRVRFVMTDTRSARRHNTMLGRRQERWLLDELATASATHALVVWVNPDPWISRASPTADDWGGFARERRRISDFVAAHDIRNLVMLSGDAHMVAIDDGSHTNYSSAPGPGFPLLQAAALDRPGNVKGGPYSEGAFPGSGQFGLLDVADDGTTVHVRLTGLDWKGRTIVTYDYTVPNPR